MGAACSQCGAGAIRIDPLFLAPSICKDGVGATYRLQVVVSPRIRDKLDDLKVKGLRQALHKKTKAPIPFWSLEPTATLPPWSPESHGFCHSALDPQCSSCHRDGFYDVPREDLQLVYDSASLPLFRDNDILATWEHFGRSRLVDPFTGSNLASPRLIVSDRVKSALAGELGVDFVRVKTVPANPH
jgi:hypothetical protein